jgi:ankyrin repeat protein
MKKTAWRLRSLRVGGFVTLAFGFAVGLPPAVAAQESLSEARAVPSLRSLMQETTDLAPIRSWIAQGADVNQAEKDGTTALHWASYWNNLPAVELLIDAGADVDASNDLGATAIWLAAENGSVDVSELLLDAGADPNLHLLSGETPVMTAAQAGHTEVLELLLSNGADPNVRATRNQTALMWAAGERHPEAVEVLLAHGADVNARSDTWPQLWQTMNTVLHAPPEDQIWVDEGGHTPLLFAARVGDLASAKLLVGAGADVNDTSAAGRSALILAIQSVIDYQFLPRPYRPIGAGFLSTHALPESDGNALVKFLLEAGADPNADKAGFTALHEAMLRRNEEVVRMLLEHGADPNAQLKAATPVRRSSHDFFFDNPFVGATPFWMAARFSQPEVMRLLVEHGADPLTDLYVDYLRDGHAAVGFARATEGPTTALMAAVGMPRGRGYAYRQTDDRIEAEALTLDAVKIAVELGVDVNAENSMGRTALDGAMALRYASVVEYLEGLGARSGRQPARERREDDEL